LTATHAGDHTATPSFPTRRSSDLRPRHPDHVHPRLRHPVVAEALPRAVQEARGDEVIVAADEDGHATFSRRARRTLNLGHGQWVSRWPSLSRFTSRQDRLSSAAVITTGT